MPSRFPLDIRLIYVDPQAAQLSRGQDILNRFPDAQRIEVTSHQNIPGLHGNAGLVKDWLRIKRQVLVLGIRKTLTMRPNGRSADFIAPGMANGCALSCAYCYVPRHKGYANPITTFANIGDVDAALRKHVQRLGPKLEPNSVDPHSWVYDLGENSDLSVDALISDNVLDLVTLFRGLPNAKASFATKYVNRNLLTYDPQGRTRLRFSLMPASMARVVDIGTSPMPERLTAINDFVEAGYEVHLNFSPVVIFEGWTAAYTELFRQIDALLSPQAKAQLAAEVIFLTHNVGLHEVNLGWHPKAEELLWTPQWQETKRSEYGGVNIRYRRGLKGKAVERFTTLLRRELPYCTVRYAF
ncbi:spore photoproduct lyase family protein [Deinococcus deserti]|uniref:Putative DNA repair photolyase distantly putative Spore photoproduct lyase SplB n=1 Tax=Deinococcus deserti (strain DSM 17065 / CIP 109153 / LMG 22923 / VCD115) TaxID=546414 RepID=C1D3U3_DEIDV|nr:spore photoproduct lyase family protein [Deinococcus deserti]ACO48172.1 putative DNA repair photolyase; distantly putative Spore photoproduct lyase SplB [Deinococcus deserti VCD115]